MKILFISTGQGEDYLRDMVLHGLREICGHEIVDVNPIESMYSTSFEPFTEKKKSSLYGRGFTLYGLLPQDGSIDRSDIPSKIKNKYFDIIIYGSIHRCQDYIHEVASMYPGNKVIFLDGEDHTHMLKGLGGIYFKRELHNIQPDSPNTFPIHFGIPKEKIARYQGAHGKTKPFASIDPMNPKTYVYIDEKSYYQDYSDSLYGITMKKAGFDCLRHYEILSQNCMPYFRCLESVPTSIMHRLPRKEMMLVKEIIEYKDLDLMSTAMTYLWEKLMYKVQKIVREKLTTEAVAKYILDTQRSVA